MNILGVCCGNRIQSNCENCLQNVSSLTKKVKETGYRIFEQIKPWNKFIAGFLGAGALFGAAIDTYQKSGLQAAPMGAVKGAATAGLGFFTNTSFPIFSILAYHTAHKTIGKALEVFTGVPTEGEIKASDAGLLLGGLFGVRYWYTEGKVEVQKEALIAVALSAILGAAIEFARAKKSSTGAIKSALSGAVMIALTGIFFNAKKINFLFSEKHYDLIPLTHLLGVGAGIVLAFKIQAAQQARQD